MSAARLTRLSRPATPRGGARTGATGGSREYAHRRTAAIIALSEAYPDLKANANFQQLQAELTDLENKIAASRRFFNNAVQEYNTGIQRFPAALFAASFGFAPKKFFDLGDDRSRRRAEI